MKAPTQPNRKLKLGYMDTNIQKMTAFSLNMYVCTDARFIGCLPMTQAWYDLI